MGVPSFFAWLVKKYPNIILKNEYVSCDALFLDWNGGIHPACRKVLDKYKGHKGKKKDIELEMISEVINYLRNIVTFSSPKKLLYIAIDGVAPFSKMNQQRGRRFKSVKEKEIINGIKKKYKQQLDCTWDTNAITPGTEFMFKLTDALKEELQTNDLYRNFNVIFSDSSVPMEGEHKIVNYIKEDHTLESYVIYGLDADLIFLSLGTHRDNIFLLREDQQFRNVVKDTEIKQPFCYLQIDYLKEKLIDEIRIGIESKISVSNVQLINDFIVYCYLLGNDFLPRIPSLNIKEHGIDNLIKNYNDTLNKGISTLIDNNEINIRFLYEMLQPLSKVEGKYFVHFHKKYGHWKPHFNFTSECEKELAYYDSLWPREPDEVKLGKKEWKDRYYQHFFEFNRFQESNKLKEINRNYLEGMNWVWKYYSKGIQSWDWFYKYHHAPVLSDFVYYLKWNQNIKFNFTLGEPAKPIQQLLSVLPPKSFMLLPAGIRKKLKEIDCPIKDFYPDDFYEDCVHKQRRWQTIPMLPFIDKNRLLEFIKDIKLTKKESERNKLNENNFCILE